MLRARPPPRPCCWSWVSPRANHQPRAPGARKRGVEALSHPHQGYPAPLLEPLAPHAHHPWASSVDLGPHPFAVESTRGASCQLDHGLRLCPHHSLRPAGHPGPCSQTRTPSGTLHLPTPSGGVLRTAGRRPKTQVPRPHGCRRQGLEWAGLLPHAPAALEGPQHTLEQELGKPL